LRRAERRFWGTRAVGTNFLEWDDRALSTGVVALDSVAPNSIGPSESRVCVADTVLPKHAPLCCVENSSERSWSDRIYLRADNSRTRVEAD
jgi:hypothetical protein